MKKKPTIKKKLNKYPDGGTSDPLKWNSFQSWVKTQKTPSGEPYVGNKKLDTNYEGTDKIDPQTLINQWNTLNPNKQITKQDIYDAQKFSGTLKTDNWYGSQTSQYTYPTSGTAYSDYSKSTYKPIVNKDVYIKRTVGPMSYKQKITYDAQGKPTLHPYETYDDKTQYVNFDKSGNPIFPFGGELWDKTKEVVGNYGKGVADATLSTFGMPDVITDDMYKGSTGHAFDKAGSIIGKVGNKALPIVANMVAPGSGQLVNVGQQLLGGLNPQVEGQENFPYGGEYSNPGMETNAKSKVVGNALIIGNKAIVAGFPMGGKKNMPCYNCEGEKMMPNGGVYNGEPNAEVEKQEVMKLPNGQVEQVNGPTHENGGVQVNIPNGTDIYSDRLKHPTLKKTFAKLAGKYKTDKEEKILSDPKSNSTAKNSAQLNLLAKNSMLDKLFEEQESLKQEKVEKYAKSLGVDIEGQEQEENQELPEHKSGGKHWIQKAINPKHKGYCTPMSKPTCTGRRRALALTFKKHHGFHAMGGTQYPDGGEYQNLSEYGLPVLDETGLEIQPEHLQKLPTNNKLNFNLNQNQQDLLGYIGSGLAQNLGTLAYLKDQGKRYDKQNFYQYNPELLSNKEELRQADIEGKLAAQNLASASGGNAGSYLSNRTALGSSLARTKAGIIENINNLNNQLKNQGQQYNIQNRYMVDDINAQNKGRVLSNYYGALNQVGQTGAGVFKDYQMNKQGNQMINLLPELYNNPEFQALMKKYGYSK